MMCAIFLVLFFSGFEVGNKMKKMIAFLSLWRLGYICYMKNLQVIRQLILMQCSLFKGINNDEK